jgi:iron complex outermembrane receptor protein
LSDPATGVFNNGKLLRQPLSDSFAFGAMKVESRFGDVALTATLSYLDRSASAVVDYTNLAGALYFHGYGNPLGTAFPVSYDNAVANPVIVHQKVLSQELRFNSLNTDAALSWVAGVFLSGTHQDYVQETYPTIAPSSIAVYDDARDTVADIAIYGQARLAFSSYWSAGLGARVGKHWDDHNELQTGYASTAPPMQQSSANESVPATPEMDLSFSPDQNNLLYTRVSKGFRPGGMNAAVGSCGASELPLSYGADSIWNYELGSKNSFFNRQLQIASDVYIMRWNDIQVLRQDRCSFDFTANAGSAASKGFDIAAHTWIKGRLELSLATAFVDVRYNSTVFADGALVVLRGTAAGGVPSVPSPWSGTATVRYQRAVSAVVSAYASAQDIVHTHNPGPFTELDPRYVNYDPRYRSDPTSNLITLQLGCLWSQLEARLTVKNLVNTHPLLQEYADAPGSQLTYAYTIRPRTIGLSSEWRF